MAFGSKTQPYPEKVFVVSGHLNERRKKRQTTTLAALPGNFTVHSEVMQDVLCWKCRFPIALVNTCYL